MSINHCSSDLPETLWWTQLQLQQYHQQQQQHHQQQQQQSTFMEPNQNPFSSSSSSKPNLSWNPQLYHHQHHQAWLNSQNSQDPMFRNPNTPFNFNLNDENDNDEDLDDQNPTSQPQEFEQQQPDDHHENEEEAAAQQKEHMFEKPLTPSDVGKLNRLVIPKQHAEKYFPLGGDSSDKGLLLSFEDESGKFWRFRYSYWNSSQSYVLTKGWSRYVKEKRLDAGDVVLFERHRTDCDRLFIGWRRRGTVAAHDSSCGGGSSSGGGVVAHNSTTSACASASGAVSEAWTRSFYNTHPYPTHHHQHHQQQHQHHSHPLPYQPDSYLYAGLFQFY